MKKPNPKNVPILNQEEEAIIQSITEKMSAQISQVVAASMIELFSKLRENRTQPADQQGGSVRPDEFLKVADVSEILKISRAQAYHLIQTREISSLSIGRTVRVRREDLEAFIQAHLVR